MNKLGATITKELLILWRDRAGMLVLFLMPAVLVLVITLVQENVLKIMGESTTRILLVDLDDGFIAGRIKTALAETDKVEMIDRQAGAPLDLQAALQEVAAGRSQACVVVPRGLAEKISRQATVAARHALDSGETGEEIAAPELEIYFDPTVLAGFRTGIINGLNLVLMRLGVEEKMAAFGAILPSHLEKRMKEAVGPAAAAMVKIPQFNISWDDKPLVTLHEKAASLNGLARIPTSVQQNVPAWSLFGIFFIVVPLAGALLKERLDGTFGRLLAMPVSCAVLLGGKVAAYVLVCFAQLGLILLIGKFLLPALGTAKLLIGPAYLPLFLVSLAAILAAVGYGVMLGAICRTYEQAAMFGAISVVVAAALGGIMVPVYAMPKMMQVISVVSPLGWGLDAYLELFVRGGGLSSVAAEIGLLTVFAFITTFIAWAALFRQARYR